MRSESTKLIADAETRFEAGDIVGAEAPLREALAQDPTDPRAWSDLGVVLFHLDRPGDAQAAFLEALATDAACESAVEGLECVRRVLDGRAPGPNDHHRNLLLVPAFPDLETLGEHLGRLAWYLAPHSPWIGCLRVLVKDMDPWDVEEALPRTIPDHLDPAVADIVRTMGLSIEVLREDDAPLPGAAPITDILVWRQDPAATPATVGGTKKRGAIPVHDVDPEFGTNRIHAIPKTLADLFPRHNVPIHQQRFAQAVADLEQRRPIQRAYVVGGGPSVHTVLDRGFEDGFTIACNCLLFDPTLVAALDPSFLAFMDACFIGPSRAGRMFRDHLTAWLDGDPCRWVVTFASWAPYLEESLPEHLLERVIGVPSEHVDLPLTAFNPDLRRAWWLPDSHNVITSISLPLASTLAKDIVVMGMDGRRPDEPYQSWGRTSDLDVEAEAEREPDDPFLRALRRTHPWRRSWMSPEYQQTYHANLEISFSRAFEAIEAEGRRVRSLTPSHMAGVAARYLP